MTPTETKVLDAINNTESFTFKKKHTPLTNLFFLIMAIAFALVSIPLFYAGSVVSSISMALLAILQAYNFYTGSDTYFLEVPKVEVKQLFKVGGVYFMAETLDEAELFAEMNGLGDFEVEQVTPFAFQYINE